MTVQVYSSADHTLNLGGINVDQGAQGPDNFVALKKTTKTFTVREGVGGGVTRSFNASEVYECTVKIRKTDPVNSALMALHVLDKATSGGVGLVPFYLEDRLGNSKVVDTQAFIESTPDLEVNAEETDVEWIVILPTAKVFVGGH